MPTVYEKEQRKRRIEAEKLEKMEMRRARGKLAEDDEEEDLDDLINDENVQMFDDETQQSNHSGEEVKRAGLRQIDEENIDDIRVDVGGRGVHWMDSDRDNYNFTR